MMAVLESPVYDLDGDRICPICGAPFADDDAARVCADCAAEGEV